MENPNYKKENIEQKYLNKMWENRFSKVKNGLLELKKDFIESKDRELKLKDRELKDREVKITREIEELFSKPIFVSKDDMDKFEQKEMKTIRPIKNTWYDWLINYIPESIRKSVGGFKDKTVSLLQISTPKQVMYGIMKKLRKPKAQNKINNIRNSFILKKKKEKDRIIKNIWALFEIEGEKKKERNWRKK